MDFADVSVGVASLFVDSPWLSKVGGVAGASSFYLSSKIMYERAVSGFDTPNELEIAAFASEAAAFTAQALVLVANGLSAVPAPQLKGILRAVNWRSRKPSGTS